MPDITDEEFGRIARRILHSGSFIGTKLIRQIERVSRGELAYCVIVPGGRCIQILNASSEEEAAKEVARRGYEVLSVHSERDWPYKEAVLNQVDLSSSAP